jgi:16S rRNA (uracil1498-N3)-methyltransferase
VTAPLFFVSVDQLAQSAVGSELILDGAEGRHGAAVMRLGVGEQVMVTDGQGHRAEAVVAGVGVANLRLKLQAITYEQQPDSRFVMVQALAKGDRDEQAIEAATELGVDEVVPWQAARSIVLWRGERAVRSLRKWESIVLAATKQSRRSRVPLVSEPANQATILARIEAAALALVLHEEAQQPLAGVELPRGGDILFIVGPEGGIAPEELSAFVAAGAMPVRLGSNVLRSSSAGPAALAVMSATGRWR